MLTALIIVAGILLVYILMMLIRKSLWDAVHRNLLDFEDNFNGKVIRSGFSSRPVFKGIINGSDVTINFSTAKSKSGRKIYIDFSFTNASNHSLTIAEKSWLQEQGNQDISPEDTINLENNNSFVVMTSDQQEIKKLVDSKPVKELLKKFENLAYFFVGKTGTICEFWSDQIDRDTQFDKMKSHMENINALQRLLK